MKSLFGGGSVPTPQPLPVAPIDDSAARKAKADAEEAAMRASNGRRSTISGGSRMVLESRTGAAREVLG
jgi:hypothetical protein